MSKPLLAATLLLLAGCGTVDHYVGLGALSPAPSPTGAFDGSYFGTAELVRARPGVTCPPDELGVVEVGDQRLSFAYAPLVIFNPPVQPDGRFHATANRAVLDGQIRRNRLVMTVRSPDCEARYRMHFIGNHS